MRRPIRELTAGVLACTLLCWATAAPALTCPGVEEREVVRLINRERAEFQLPALSVDVRLTDAARRHSRDMAEAGFFDHTGSDGSSFWDRCTGAGYPMRAGGENIAAGYRTPALTVAGWMNSPGHRAIILTEGYENIGVGLMLGGSHGLYWTAEFGRGDDGGLAPEGRCSGGNLPPVAAATAPETAAEAEVVTLDGDLSSDPEGSALAFLWVQLAGPPVDLFTPNESMCTFTMPAPDPEAGAPMFQLTVADSGGLEASTQVTVETTAASASGAGTASSTGGGPDGVGGALPGEGAGGCFLQVLERSRQVPAGR